MPKLRDNFLFHWGILFLLILILRGWPVPTGNELLYFVPPIRQFDPTFILNDWFFSRPFYPHYFFNLFSGLFNLLLSAETVGWLGRLLCWSLTIIALLRLGEHFGIPLWAVSLSISLWLIYGQSLVGGEFVIGTFEPKAIAYTFLLFSLTAFIKKEHIRASVLLGLTFTFHPAVGLFAILSIGPSLLILRYPLTTVLKITFLTTISSAPLFFLITPEVFGHSALSSEGARFLALVRAPIHLDPLSWPKRYILLLYVLFLFNWMHFRIDKSNKALQFLILFQMFLCLFFSLGVLCRLSEHYWFLKFMPFRHFPVFTLLFFFFHLMNAYCRQASIRPPPALIAVGFLALLSFGSPVSRLLDGMRLNYDLWVKKVSGGDDIKTAFKWIAKNTPNGSITILPPWRRDGWYLSQRAQIACLRYFPGDHRFEEWLERNQSLVGKIESQTSVEEMEHYYNNLAEKDIASVVRKYGGEYLVSKRDYSYTRLFDSGSYKVYALKREHPRLVAGE